MRLVKIFRFVYDFQYERCIPRVQRKTISCRSAIQDPNDLDGDGYDDVTGMPTTNDYSKWKYDSHYSTPYDYYHDYANDYGHDFSNEYSWRDGYMRADDFHGQKSEKFAGKNAQAQKNNEKSAQKSEKTPEFGEKLTPEEEQELKGLTDGPVGGSSDRFEKAEKPSRFENPEALDQPESPRIMSKKQPEMPRRAQRSLEESPMPDAMDSADSFDVNPPMNQKSPQSLASKKKPAVKASNSSINQE